ncbi:DUF2076 domain-containing protein [Cupriavidus sp. 30B13]|uniref:DUF2076 domain-containing protein n=1 Tax=Cupriavidus sp. 30B13 TaxID=3384241 RepID=UPI003B911E96
MTPQEMQALDGFLTQLTQARAGAKDPQAEALIADAVARQPDAAYLLVQRALLLDHALASAKTQIAALQNQLQAAQAGGANRFLDTENAWGVHASPAVARPVMPPPASAPASLPPEPPAMPAQAARPGFLSGGLGSALGGIATTAAGVAGGAFLFQGLENLFHHNSGSGFLGQPAAGALPTETVVNNYYDNDDRLSQNQNDGGLDNGLDDLGTDDFLDDDSFNA